MKRIKTLRVRFALWTASLFLAILTVFGIYVYASMAYGLSTAVDNSLTLNASQIAAGLNIDNGKLILSDSLAESPENARLRGREFTVCIFDATGKPVQEFGGYRNLPVSLSESFASYSYPGTTAIIRIYNQPVYDNKQFVAVVQVAQSLDDMQDTLGRLLLTLLISVPILVAVAGTSGYFLAARALAPIDHITLTARRISAEDLSARLNLPATDDEVGRLTQTFDEMLARLDNSFQRERQFANDASHELRTPLAAMQAILEMTREKRRTDEEYEQALDDLAEEADRLQNLVEYLLQLSRGENHNPILNETIDLAMLIKNVTNSLQPLARAKNLLITCAVPENLTVLGDSDGLIRIFVNLLDNAIKYTEAGEISITTQQHEKEILITIQDTGVGIAPEHIPHIFERFYRVSQSRSSRGAGLGLAIALEIAHAHNGNIEVESEAGKGTTFTVQLPVLSET